MPENVNKKLFDEFPPVSTAQWEEVIRADLKGADYEKKLVWKTPEGIPLRPYYRSEDLKGLEHLKSLPGKYPYVRGTKTGSNDWLVRQDIVVDDPGTANIKALDALMKGAGSVGFVLKDKFDYSPQTVALLLKDICLASAELNFIPSGRCSRLPELIDKENISRGGAVSDLHGAIEYDPLGILLVTGNFAEGEEVSFDMAASMVNDASRLSNFKVININASVFHNAGGSAVQELAFGLSGGAEYLERLTAAGIPVITAAEKMKLTFASGSNYFMEIAKFRAARYLWTKLVEAWDTDPDVAEKIVIHAVTSRWNKTIYDPFVNMLRSTTESMSAILGGADSLTVEPFDKAFSKGSNPFSERIARNSQLVLKEEAYFDKVVDPAAGSYYIESLTGALIEQSWDLFLKTTDMGGLVAAFKAGFIQEQVEETASRRDNFLASRRDTLLGTNQYPNSEERVIDKIDISKVRNEVPKADNQLARPLRIYRGAQAFEELRLKTEQHTGGRPKVFLLTYGNLAMRKARAGFASGFFGCAGYEIIDNLGFTDPAEGAKAALKSNASIVVVCSSDDEYPEIVPVIARELKDNLILVVAGYPKDSIEQLMSAGVKHFIHVRSNVLESLQQFQSELGIK